MLISHFWKHSVAPLQDWRDQQPEEKAQGSGTAVLGSLWQASPQQHLQVVGYAHANKFLQPRQRMKLAVALEDFSPPLSLHHWQEDRLQSPQQ